jgi:hypothetical protein
VHFNVSSSLAISSIGANVFLELECLCLACPLGFSPRWGGLSQYICSLADILAGQLHSSIACAQLQSVARQCCAGASSVDEVVLAGRILCFIHTGFEGESAQPLLHHLKHPLNYSLQIQGQQPPWYKVWDTQQDCWNYSWLWQTRWFSGCGTVNRANPWLCLLKRLRLSGGTPWEQVS